MTRETAPRVVVKEVGNGIPLHPNECEPVALDGGADAVEAPVSRVRIGQIEAVGLRGLPQQPVGSDLVSGWSGEDQSRVGASDSAPPGERRSEVGNVGDRRDTD